MWKGISARKRSWRSLNKVIHRHNARKHSSCLISLKLLSPALDTHGKAHLIANCFVCADIICFYQILLR